MASISRDLESSLSSSTATTTGHLAPPDSPTSPHSAQAAALAANNNAGVAKRYRAQPPKTFQCRGYGDCKMVFSRSEHLARHVRKHTGERPFTCHCSKQFSRLDNLRQHAQTVHADKADQNEALMRELTTLHAAMAAGKGRKRNANANGQRSPVSPTTPTVPSSSDPHRLSPSSHPPQHIAPHNRNLDYPGLAAQPFPGSVALDGVMSNSAFGHMYHHHHQAHLQSQSQQGGGGGGGGGNSFRTPSVESASSHQSFQHADFHAQSFPASASQHFQSDSGYRQPHPSLGGRGHDSFRADSPNSTTNSLSPVSAIPNLPSPPPPSAHPSANFQQQRDASSSAGAAAAASSGGSRAMDARHSQQQYSFPFQHHAQQQQQQQQRSDSGSPPLAGRSLASGASMESAHGALARDGNGHHHQHQHHRQAAGSVMEGQWGSSSAAAYASLSAAHGVDPRGGQDGRASFGQSDYPGGNHSFRHSTNEHGFQGHSFLGSGYALPPLPSIVGGSGATGSYATSFIGNAGEGQKSATNSREATNQSAEFQSDSRPATRDKLPSSRMPSFPLPSGIDTTINVHHRPLPGYGGHIGYNLEARRPGTAPAAYAYGYPRPRTAGAPLAGFGGFGAAAAAAASTAGGGGSSALAAIPESLVVGNGIHVVPSHGPPRTGVLQQQYYHHHHHQQRAPPPPLGGFGPGGESGFDNPGVGALGDNSSPFSFHPPPLSTSGVGIVGSGLGGSSLSAGWNASDAGALSPGGYAPPSSSASYAEPPPPTGPLQHASPSVHSSFKRLRTAGGLSSSLSLSSISAAASSSADSAARPGTGATSRPQSRRLGVMDLINESAHTDTPYGRFRPPHTSPAGSLVKSPLSTTHPSLFGGSGQDAYPPGGGYGGTFGNRLKRSRSPEFASEHGDGEYDESDDDDDDGGEVSPIHRPVPSLSSFQGEDVVMKSVHQPNSKSSSCSPPLNYTRSPGSVSVYGSSKSSPRSVASLRASVVAS